MKLMTLSHWNLILFLMIPLETKAFTLLNTDVLQGWDTVDLAFNVNESSCTALGISASQLNEAIDSAVELWNKVPHSKIKLRRGDVVTSPTTVAAGISNPPVIVCNTGQIASPDVVAAEGYAFISSSKKRPTKGFIQLNGDNTKAVYFGNLSTTKAAVVMAHEMGHVLGLGHTEKSYALMYYNYSLKENFNLSQDDMDGLAWLNPRDEWMGRIMGCATVEDISKIPPPPGGSAGVIANWLLLFLFSYGVICLVRTRKNLSYQG